MAKGQQRSNREVKKPKKDKAKVIAAAPTRKDAALAAGYRAGEEEVGSCLAPFLSAVVVLARGRDLRSKLQVRGLAKAGRSGLAPIAHG